MQQGYFDQCNDIISNLEETLSALQLTVSDLHAWAFGESPIKEQDSELSKASIPSRVMQNRLIDALEHATAILSDANEVQIFMMGGEYEGAPDDWVDDLQQSAQASPVKQAKPETLEAVEVARNIVDGRNAIMVGKHEVPAPMKRKPSLGATFYYPAPERDAMFVEDIWIASITNDMMFDAGWLHATKEAAIAHAKALIAVSKGE